MRIAAIDIGTNAVLLLVADGSAGGQPTAVLERATITRLGEGVDRSRRLSLAGIERTRQCLEEYALEVRRLGVKRLTVVGTSAMRDTGGGEDVREYVRTLFGVDARVLTGGEEARLTFRGALSAIDVPAGENIAVFDVGGGSTEVIVGRMEATAPVISFGASYEIGSVRLTERHFRNDPPTVDERRALADACRSAFTGVPPLPNSRAPVGAAGTMTTLAAVSLGLRVYDAQRVHGHAMPVAEMRRVVNRLASLSVDERRRVPGMEPKRADVIVAGGTIALTLLEQWGAGALQISDRGVRWGVAEELLLG